MRSEDKNWSGAGVLKNTALQPKFNMCNCYSSGFESQPQHQPAMLRRPKHHATVRKNTHEFEGANGRQKNFFPTSSEVPEAYMASDVQRRPFNSYKRLCAKVKFFFSGIVLVQCTWMISRDPSIMGHNMVWLLAPKSLVYVG